jgi:hypothetical protein
MASARDIAETAGRMALRATVGRAIRARAAKTDNLERVADLLSTKPKDRSPLEYDHFRRAAAHQNWNPAVLHALSDVESRGFGFDDDGRLIILVEPHVFSKETQHAFDASHPHLSYPKWIRPKQGAPAPRGMEKHPYFNSPDERWGMFALQAELDLEAACCAISAGRFQQLGRGWRDLGFGSAEELIRLLWESELQQLAILIRYLLRHNLSRAVKDLDWRALARGYNGSGQVDVYAPRMAERYKARLRYYA